MNHTIRATPWLPALLAITVGCSSASPTDAAVDASAVDTNTIDANATDTGAADASAVDTNAADTGAADASTADVASLVVHGCTAFVDRTADAADRTVHFSNFQYDPRCMLVAVGQRVTFSGDFAVHQFRPGIAPSRTATDPAGTPGTPITARDDGTSATFAFAAAGTFPFFCLDHEGTGMYGAVRAR